MPDRAVLTAPYCRARYVAGFSLPPGISIPLASFTSLALMGGQTPPGGNVKAVGVVGVVGAVGVVGVG